VPTILLAQEDAEARQSFSALILDFFPTAKLQSIESWADLEPLLATPSPAAVVLSDILWQQADHSAELLLLAERFPAIPFAVFGRYDLTGSLPAGYPIPLLSPDEQLPLRLAEIMENLSGREVGPYKISGPAAPHALGRLYWAQHHQLGRSVQILVPPAGSPGFPRAIRAMARVTHPSVYSLYESIPWENRVLVAQEPVIHPSLLHLRMSGQKPGLLACARLATSLASVMAEMEASSVPARLLGEYDYTLSPKGTPRLRNPAALSGQPEASLDENARHLAGILEPFLPGQPKSAPLLQILAHPGTSAFDLLCQTREFERQLAEVREVRVRKEELEAAAKTLRARVIRRWAMALGAVAFLAYLGVFARTFFDRFLLDVPATLAEAELPVPGGTVTLEGETIKVPAFFLDRHEVTIGDYEKFLAAIVDDPDWIRFVPEPHRPQKKSPADLHPRDWGEILRRARKQEPYQAQNITRDTPVFNVDYPSAAAYAAWKGRRLPTMEEWLRAASGDDSSRFPWGKETDQAPANLGIRRDLPARSDPGDSFFNAAPGESFPGDQGPFGHLDLGGNVSEWAVGPFKRPVAMGGNFTDPNPIPLPLARRQDGNRNDPPAQTQLEMIGFRTAR
jgi:formylglycine-generating enzyme required for sulfatase activity